VPTPVTASQAFAVGQPMPMPQPQSQPQSQPSPGAVVVGVDHAPHGGSSAAASDDGYAEEYNEGSEEGEGEAFTAADARAERRRDGRLHGYQAPVAREKGVSQASNRRVKQRRAYSLPRLPFHHAGLLVAECGKCANCQDMLKFGGQGLRKRACVQREAAKWEAALALAQKKVSSPEALTLAAGAYSLVCAAQSGQKEDDAQENAEDNAVASAEEGSRKVRGRFEEGSRKVRGRFEEGSTAERTAP